MARIIKIQMNKVKGQPPVEVDSLTLVEGVGIEGDRHQEKTSVQVDAGSVVRGSKKVNHDRDVCICRKELLDWMKEQPVAGMCFARHKENLLIEGFSADELVPGVVLAGEEAELRISNFPKHCFPEECSLAEIGIECQLSKEWQMARIVKSGVVRTGEKVVLKQ